MVERDRRDGRRRPASITLVASSRPPRPTSQHRDVDPGAAEQLERHGGRHFEERRVRLQHAARQQRARWPSRTSATAATMRVGGDRPAVDDESLGQIDQMGRGVARRSWPAARKRGVDHRRDRALAVGAGDVDGSERPLGMAERVDDRGDVLEAELDAELFEAEELVERVGHRDASARLGVGRCGVGCRARPPRRLPAAGDGTARCASRP